MQNDVLANSTIGTTTFKRFAVTIKPCSSKKIALLDYFTLPHTTNVWLKISNYTSSINIRPIRMKIINRISFFAEDITICVFSVQGQLCDTLILTKAHTF